MKATVWNTLLGGTTNQSPGGEIESTLFKRGLSKGGSSFRRGDKSSHSGERIISRGGEDMGWCRHGGSIIMWCD